MYWVENGQTAGQCLKKIKNSELLFINKATDL